MLRISVLVSVDLVAAAVGLLATFFWQSGGVPGAGDRASILSLFLVLVLFGQAGLRTYGPGNARRNLEKVAWGVLASAAGLAVVGSMSVPFVVSPGVFALGVATSGFLICASRLLVELVMRGVYRLGVGRKRTLIVGDLGEAQVVIQRLRAIGEPDLDVVGYISPAPDGEEGALGRISQIAETIETLDVTNVIVSGHLEPAQLQRLVQECFLHGTSMSVVPATLSSVSCRISGGDILGWPLITLDVPRLHFLQVLTKRGTDLIVSACALVALLPLMVLVAASIKLLMPGPVLFRQKRLGVGGKPFTIYKFRSMRADAEEVLQSDPALYERYRSNGYKLPPNEDPRIPPLGSLLRRSSLDELPQLFNVLRGDMSLVGPRPIVPQEIENYGEQAPVFLGVRPGVTGYWQVNGRSAVGYPERVNLDMHYISNWSFWLDLRILGSTVPSILRRNGAH